MEYGICIYTSTRNVCCYPELLSHYYNIDMPMHILVNTMRFCIVHPDLFKMFAV